MKQFNLEASYIKESAARGLKKLVDAGFPKEKLEEILKVARPIGDFSVIKEDYDFDYASFQELFSISRMHGLDESLDVAFGGSSAPNLLGLTRYEGSTPIDEWMKMTGVPVVEKDDPYRDEIFFAGHMAEDLYRKYFQYKNKEKYEVYECDIQFASKVYPHFLMNIDGLIIDKETGEYGIFENKTTDPSNFNYINKWKNEGVPTNYIVQGLSYAEGLGASFVCFNLGYGARPSNMVSVRVENDGRGKEYLKDCEEFIEKYVLTGTRPEVTLIQDKDLMKSIIAKEVGPLNKGLDAVEMDDTLLPALATLIDAKNALDELKKVTEAQVAVANKAYEDAQVPFIKALGQAPEGTIVDGDKTWKISYTSKNSLDVEKLKAEKPDIYDEVQKPSVDTTLLKNLYPEIHKEYSAPSPNAKRTFSIK